MFPAKSSVLLRKFKIQGSECSTKYIALQKRLVAAAPVDSRIVRGRATPEATKDFLVKSKVSLSHRFFKSSLFINPVIHGPPARTEPRMTKHDADRNIAKAVLHNCSNCVYIYDFDNKDPSKTWHSNILFKLVSEHKAVTREEVVTVAGLGFKIF